MPERHRRPKKKIKMLLEVQGFSYLVRINSLFLKLRAVLLLLLLLLPDTIGSPLANFFLESVRGIHLRTV